MPDEVPPGPLAWGPPLAGNVAQASAPQAPGRPAREGATNFGTRTLELNRPGGAGPTHHGLRTLVETIVRGSQTGKVRSCGADQALTCTSAAAGTRLVVRPACRARPAKLIA